MEIIDGLFYFAELLDGMVVKYGALGITMAMFAESAGIPFASALVILTAGQMIASGKISIVGAITASIVGITMGSLLSYILGLLGQKIGRVINITVFHKKIRQVPYQQSKLNNFFERYGNFSIFIAQLIGTTRTFISFPAGAMHMNIFLFLLYTTLGGAIFSVAAIGFSMILNQVMALVFRLLRELINMPLWIWPIILLILIVCYCGFRYFQQHVLHGRKS